MSETRFTDQHEWVRLEGEEATIASLKLTLEKSTLTKISVSSCGAKGAS